MKATSVFCLGLTLALLAPLGSILAGPNLQLSETEFDFGQVPQNSSVSHVFVIENTGDDSLVIDKIVPGCGCTKAPLKKSVLAAGESTEVEIIFSTRRYSGKVSKQPRIFSNAGATPQTVTIRAEVMPEPTTAEPVTVSPYKLNLTQFGSTERSSMSFALENRSDQSLSPVLVDSPSNLIGLELPDEIPPRSSAAALITLLPGNLEVPITASITIELNDPGQTRLTIPVTRKLMESAQVD